MSVKIGCDCGSIRGEIVEAAQASLCICYCQDCQAFARHLEQHDTVLDTSGGTKIVQTHPANLRFTDGVENLACLRLTENGLLRWYALCCEAPLCNTPASMKIPFVGLIHTCIKESSAHQENVFGQVRAIVNTNGANVDPKPKSKGLPWYLFRVVGMMLKARLNGSFKRGPFFDSSTRKPRIAPTVLTDSERDIAYTAHFGRQTNRNNSG